MHSFLLISSCVFCYACIKLRAAKSRPRFASFTNTLRKQKSKKLFKQESIKNFALVGGASANLYIRDAYEKLCVEFDKNMLVAPLEYCSDNAAMIGRYAIDLYHKNEFIDPNEIDIISTKKLQAQMRL